MSRTVTFFIKTETILKERGLVLCGQVEWTLINATRTVIVAAATVVVVAATVIISPSQYFNIFKFFFVK